MINIKNNIIGILFQWNNDKIIEPNEFIKIIEKYNK